VAPDVVVGLGRFGRGGQRWILSRVAVGLEHPPALDDLERDHGHVVLAAGAVGRLDESARDPDPIAALARVIAESSDARRAHAAAEYELFLLAGRRAELKAEVDRWTTAVDAYLAPHVGDPVRRAAVAAAVDGLFLRCFVATDPPSADEVRALLASILGC